MFGKAFSSQSSQCPLCQHHAVPHEVLGLQPWQGLGGTQPVLPWVPALYGGCAGAGSSAGSQGGAVLCFPSAHTAEGSLRSITELGASVLHFLWSASLCFAKNFHGKGQLLSGTAEGTLVSSHRTELPSHCVLHSLFPFIPHGDFTQY